MSTQVHLPENSHGNENVQGTPTLSLLSQDLFKPYSHQSAPAESVAVSYLRAQAIGRAYGLTVQDVLHLTPKFWQMHTDMAMGMDAAALTLVTIQYNLAAGTIAPYMKKRPDLVQLMDNILQFNYSAQFLLTEIGHGLDAANLETRATLLPNGEFDFHTPTANAAKYMPPTSPVGLPRVAVVIARLIVKGEDRGVRPFIVWLNDGHKMCDGVTCKVLPRRTGSKPVDHSLTYFNHVRLPGSALLGSLDTPVNMRLNFLATIWRVGVGTLALSTSMIPMLKRGLYVAGKYSMRRTVQGSHNKPMAIIGFRTQQRPILHALAQVYVFDAYAEDSARLFVDTRIEGPVRHGIGTVLKAVVNQATQGSLHSLAERCGAQGLFEYNNIIESQLEGRGISVAEGDVLALCIRLASELLLGRYQMPAPKNPQSLLALHERGLFKECWGLMKTIKGGHRSDEFNNLILPRCQPLIEAVGQRMAYEAASQAGVHPDLLALYEIGAIMQDPSWYVQHAGLGREAQFMMEEKALNAVLPRLEELLEGTGAGPYCDAPILFQGAWDAFIDRLVKYETPRSDKTQGVINRTSRL
ncbi:hypothetical protein DTO027B5_8754 [Paecilomyces variotii]|nr:hypothetical protein DTO169C6_8883 [Paecilomyces variotii]KAJ9229619.1 hypothetical protein DTO169E5_8806 [Paecilomyces variotii]KAJ9251484.1 hypothetical protein DTO207G8_5377 [Paecilomyces variotii]KAJ9327271.1 hypothetical protein DTO027B3_2035 [Paecilomyces variotii]KAJ9328388.1 hypothetical protein DTO027B5_8754 [Paecilomyces variotii]